MRVSKEEELLCSTLSYEVFQRAIRLFQILVGLARSMNSRTSSDMEVENAQD